MWHKQNHLQFKITVLSFLFDSLKINSMCEGLQVNKRLTWHRFNIITNQFIFSLKGEKHAATYLVQDL